MLENGFETLRNESEPNRVIIAAVPGFGVRRNHKGTSDVPGKTGRVPSPPSRPAGHFDDDIDDRER